MMYPQEEKPATPCLWFGKHRGVPLPDVPTDYLTWALRTVKLSSGIRQAVVAELAGRGAAIPPPPPGPRPCWKGPCSRCGSAEVDYRWHEFSNGVMQIRATCLRCGQQLGHAPRVPPFTDLADAAASPTPVLDALLLAEQESVELISDGRSVRIGRGWDRASDRLKDAVRQRGRLLASMLGDTTKGS